MDRQTALDIGKAIGVLVTIDWKDWFGGWTEFMRIKVKIDIEKPLRRVVRFVDKDGSETIGLIKYERLPDFCFSCGIIGHTLKTCITKVDEEEMNDIYLQFGSWMRAPLATPNQERGTRRNGVEVFKPMTQSDKNKEDDPTNSRDVRGKPNAKGNERVWEGESRSTSPMEKRIQKLIKDGMGKTKNKRKRQKSSQGDYTDESPVKLVRRRIADTVSPLKAVAVRELKQLLVANVPDIVFLCEKKVHSNEFSRIRDRCRMDGYLAVSSEGKSGGLALMWREGVRVTVQNYSKYHIDSLVKMDNGEVFRFTGIYGQTIPALRHQAWDMLKRVSSSVNEGWIVGGDFNAILNNSEKEGGRRKPKVLMDEFCDLIEELNLND
ncbi:hypothetical protein Golax_022194, partial [Gossypium laxum]|nr:hypothetical protein [Gossypium laxum]